MTRYDSRLITPPSEEEEIYPYRRAWLSVALELGTLFGIVLGLYLVTRFISIPEGLYQPLNILIALLPVGIWLIFSWSREARVPRPRQRLVTIVVIAALVANALGLPIIQQVFQVERWLPLQSAINRIIGYTFSVGLIQAILMYLIMRYTIWPDHLRVRLDAVAYGTACAVGYATVVNLDFVLSNATSPDVTAMNVFNQLALLSCGGIIIGYGLAEITFNRYPFPLLLAATIALAAFATGVGIPLIAGFTNAGISPENPVSSVNPILGVLFATGLLAGISIIFSFLFDVAERQET
ncbi:MAG: PrsW family intramembrane metalloprotease, partial [Anaerolineae bacterium]|nr:PrsW family intramembrane metalloprotease [Anaerolineae bacterium]